MAVKLKVFQKGLVLVGVPLLISTAFIGGLAVLLEISEKQRQQEISYRQAANIGLRLLSVTSQLPLLAMASLQFNSAQLLATYERKRKQSFELFAEARKLMKTIPELDVPESEWDQHTLVLEKIDGLADLARKGNVMEHMDELQARLSEMDDMIGDKPSQLQEACADANKLTEEIRNHQNEINLAEQIVLAVGLIGNIVAGVALSIYFKQSIVDRVNRISENAFALSRGKRMLPVLEHGDEIALVDNSIHQMYQQLVAASDRERLLFENASEIIFACDREGRITKINPSSKTLWGFNEDELIGRRIQELSLANDTGIRDAIEKALTDLESVNFEAAVMTKPGRAREMRWSLNWSDADQRLYGVAQDQTEAKQIEKSKQRFLSMISSNLMTPLHSISNSLLTIVRRQPSRLSEKAAKRLNSASGNLERLVALVSELFELNSSTSADIKIKKSDATIDDIFRRAAQDVESLALKKRIELKVNAANIRWKVDANRIVQVLVNLMSNAIKFSPEGSSIFISSKIEGDFIKCFVQDQGRGIPEEQRKKIFERFSQTELADGKRSAGTGLGLPICKTIIEKHGGSIDVDSDGTGSTFWFTIPMHENSALVSSAAKQKSATRELQKNTRADLSKTRTNEISNAKQSPLSKVGLTGKGLLLISVPVFCEVILAGSLAYLFAQVENERLAQAHNRMISTKAFTVLSNASDAQVRLSRLHEPVRQQNLAMANEDLIRARAAENELRELVKDDIILTKCEQIIDKKLAEKENFFSLPQDRGRHHRRRHRRRENGQVIVEPEVQQPEVSDDAGMPMPPGANPEMTRTIGTMKRSGGIAASIMFFHSIEKMAVQVEKRESSSPAKQLELRRTQELVLLAGFATNILASLLLVVFFSKDINSRLMVLVDNANRLANDKELNPVLDGSDEIAKLDQSFHQSANILAEARRKERSIFDNSQDAICVMDSNGKWLSFNPACEQIWGYSKDELKEKNLFSITHPDDLEATQKAFSEENRAPHTSFENRVLHANGNSVNTLWSIAKKEGEPFLFCVAHDITARKQLEGMKKEFLAMVSHDLRTPLTSILGAIDLISVGATGPVPEEDKPLLQEASVSCSRLIDLINDLLDIDKIEAGKMQLSKERIVLKDMLKKAVEQSGRSIQVENIENAAANFVEADPERLTRAVSGIIAFSAARKARRHKLTIQSVPDGISITLRDDAPALSAEQRAVLLDQDSATAISSAPAEEANAWLLLTLAFRIIESHEGKCAVFSNETGNQISILLQPVTATAAKS